VQTTEENSFQPSMVGEEFLPKRLAVYSSQEKVVASGFRNL
jgi:hypothetical protein